MAYTIDLKIMGGLTATQQEAFGTAVKRWESIITGDLPPGAVNGRQIDGLLIEAAGKEIDGTGGVLGRAGPVFIRSGSNLPIMGVMEFDTADLHNMELDGTLEGVILHEMGHVIGIGTMWETMKLVQGLRTNNPTFIGNGAVEEYAVLRKSKAQYGVPVANTGGPGTFGGHWRESTFDRELMTGYVDQGGMPISRMTVAALSDMGYTVNPKAADPYKLPPNSFNIIQRSHSCRHSGKMRRPVRWIV